MTQVEPPYANSKDSVAEILSELPVPEIITWDKKLIKKASLNVEVEDFKKFNAGLHSLVTQYSGYIAAERNSYSEYKNESVVTIKVPTARFEDLLNQLNNQASRTIDRTISTQDVTGEMKDNKSRLQTKKETRLKYLEFLKKSKNIDEVIKVQNEINSIQEEMEMMSGTQNQLVHQTTFSTIELTFSSMVNNNSTPVEKPGFADRFITSFGSGISVIGKFLILIAKLWPFLFIGFIGWLILKKKKIAKV